MLLLVNLTVTLVLTGLIWTVQVVHYPLFARVPAADWHGYHQDHSRRITWLVGPLMLVEAAAAAMLVIEPPAGVTPIEAALAGSLVAVAWLATALLSVPIHRRLAGGFSLPDCRRLTATNWIRTAAWTARAALLLVVVWRST